MRVEREWDASGVGMNRRNEAQKRGRSGETERERSVNGARVEREWSASGARVIRRNETQKRGRSGETECKRSASGAHSEKAERLKWGGDQPSKGERENQMRVGLSRAGWRKRKR